MAMTGISKSTLGFLSELREHNNKPWFTEHKARYQKEHALFKTVMEALRSEMVQHDDIAKLKIFRIYRDVRFSKDKTPYKSNFSAFLSRQGADKRGGYYIHIEPGKSFLGVGFWKPEKEDLYRIRKEWETDASELRAILARPDFHMIWGDLEGEEVKTAPKGFDKEHPNIDFIKKKQYIFKKALSDTTVISPNFVPEVTKSFRAIRPYFDLMSAILTTDLNGASLIDP